MARNDTPKLVTRKELTEFLRISTTTVRRWERCGKLHVHRAYPGAQPRYNLTEILKQLEGGDSQ